MANAEWVADVCSDVDTSSTSGSGAMSEDAGRLSDAMSMIGQILGCVMDGDGGCGKYEGETKEYGESLQNSVMGPGVVLAGIVLVVWLPLWISRCCAHRCCAPSRPSYGSKERGLACGCCSCCGAGIGAACLVGIMCVAQAAKGAQDAMCTAHASLGVLEVKMREVDAAIDATRTQTDEFVQSLDPFIASVDELANAYGSGGNMSIACAELQIVADSVANLSSIVNSTTQFTELNATLHQGIDEACTSLRDQVEGPAAAAVGDLEGAQADARALYDNIPNLQEFENAADEVDNVVRSLTDAMHDSWDHLSGNTASALGVAVFGVPLLLLVGACLGGERCQRARPCHLALC